MTKETDSDKCVLGGTGITAGENVIFENINSPIAVGANINISLSDIEDLKRDLLAFKEAISKSNLLPEDKTIAEGDITAAIKESENETPKLEKITKRVVSAIETIQETGKKMEEYGLFDIASKIAKRLAISAILT
ncbi:hypothetical protein MSBRW_2007 [Methanosarcina barkeri str. Wiesmoor]|uniref:Uncharacterized protein n=2 Tax=Methanosarcina barkeri TaxID=2208 RepID=A0A0E3QN93_METBA|nr:hypothetical protein [Methanosarcina barkeri]AKB51260.1 hypothetical protein MSBRW_2007 [Methanosarcina barkeri str. Wiesmoor]